MYGDVSCTDHGFCRGQNSPRCFNGAGIDRDTERGAAGRPYALPLRRRFLHRSWRPHLRGQDRLHSVDIQYQPAGNRRLLSYSRCDIGGGFWSDRRADTGPQRPQHSIGRRSKIDGDLYYAKRQLYADRLQRQRR